MIRYFLPLLFLGAGFSFFVARLLFLRKIIEVNLYNTYYILSKKKLATYSIGAMLFLALIYELFSLFNKPLNTNLGIIHFLITTLGILLAMSAPIFDSVPGDYKKTRQNREYLTKFCLVALLIFCLGQTVIFFNIAWTFF